MTTKMGMKITLGDHEETQEMKMDVGVSLTGK
jgi:hypothetical protein